MGKSGAWRARESRTDLLFSVAVRDATASDRRVFVYVLFEHQSRPDRLMVLRFLGYFYRAWLELSSQPRHADGLPPIVPVVLHHGDDGWTAPRRLVDLLAIDHELTDVLGPYVPNFELLIDDLARVPELALADRSISEVALLVLVALRIDRLGHDPELTGRWAAVLNEAAAHGGPAAFSHLLRYLVESARGSEWLEALAEEDLSEEAKEGIVTLQQQWLQEGMEKGIQQGIDKGIQQGLERGQVALLLELIDARFGPPSAELEAQVRAGTTEQLRRWARLLVQADTLDDIFA